MRIGWRIPLPGPFYVGGTVWRSRQRGRRFWWHGVILDSANHRACTWQCPHDHRRSDTAYDCAARRASRYGGGTPDARMRARGGGGTVMWAADVTLWLLLAAFLLWVIL